jgi:hypothetical protein
MRALDHVSRQDIVHTVMLFARPHRIGNSGRNQNPDSGRLSRQLCKIIRDLVRGSFLAREE